MRRFWIVLGTVLIVSIGVAAPRALTVSASGHSHLMAAQKKCKKGFHRVRGKCTALAAMVFANHQPTIP